MEASFIALFEIHFCEIAGDVFNKNIFVNLIFQHSGIIEYIWHAVRPTPYRKSFDSLWRVAMWQDLHPECSASLSFCNVTDELIAALPSRSALAVSRFRISSAWSSCGQKTGVYLGKNMGEN